MITRRDFLAGAAVGLGCLASGVRLLADDPPGEKLDIGLVGVGGQGRANLEGVASQNVKAICDVDGNNLAEAAKRFPRAATYRDFRRMLDSEDLDAVVVSTPDHTHAVAAAAAIDLGLAVYCEKPLCHSVHECRVLQEKAVAKRVATQMGNQGHAGEGPRRTAEILASGAIGRVREVHAWSDRPIWPQGGDRPEPEPAPRHLDWDLWLGPAPERPYHANLHPFAWRGWWDFGTGALGDMACHVLDPAFYALHLDAPRTIEAEGEPRKPEMAPLWETVIWTFGARGDHPPLKLVWYDGKKTKDGREVRNLPAPDLAPGADLTRVENGSLFVGERGALLLHDAYGDRRSLLPAESFAGWTEPPAILPRSKGHHAEWIEGAKGRGTCGSNFDYAAPMTETILLGIVAFRARSRIEWNSERMEATGCPEADPFLRREYRKGWT
ncbi:MAG: Gfo/Idh/MocA family oxidoreductase [Planctomycetes bacterium]|nr:Gfo/Idh/MocA family oxidoreductase [Planctomycetota bacterium]